MKRTLVLIVAILAVAILANAPTGAVAAKKAAKPSAQTISWGKAQCDKADKLLEKGDLEAAADLYHQVLRKLPASPRAKLELKKIAASKAPPKPAIVQEPVKTQPATANADIKDRSRHLLDQVYSGSLGSIQGELERSFQKGNSDRITSGTSAALRQQFGAIQDLKLQSVEKAPMNSTVAIWTVMAKRGNFEMKVVFDGESKVIGLSFRSSSSQDWTPSHILGMDYLKPGSAARYAPNLMKGRP